MMPRKPRIALAMMDGLLGYAVTEDHLVALEQVGQLTSREPLTDFTNPAVADILADTEVLLGHWGCPTLSAEVLDVMPRLRMLAYAAGTVKWQVTDALWERGSARDKCRRSQRGAGCGVRGCGDRAGQQGLRVAQCGRTRPDSRGADRPRRDRQPCASA